ncbi:hypothetical protein ABTZ58_01335 [Streptomyces sp. NPDC094143]|uniref:hypothetical protein n=1 Tax=Streptomyces sp. NPDC094143 TaxID=3155310 RepID=UPI003325469B
MRTIVHRHLDQAVPPGVVERPAAEGERGTGRDPPAGDGPGRAERIALSRQRSRSGEPVDGGRGPQRLGVGLAEPGSGEAGDPAAPRPADVTCQEYRDDTCTTRTVGTVVRTGTRRGVQPPRSAAVTAGAAPLIADPLGAGLGGNHRRWRVASATGKNKDGHARSYEIVPGPTRYPGRGCAKHDPYVTR